MRNKLAVTIAFFAIMAGGFASAALELLEPAHAFTSDGAVVDLGVVGPGQSLEIVASASTSERSSLKEGVIAVWDQLNIVESSLPKGWMSENAKTYEKPFHAFVKVSPEAADGQYVFSLQAVDEYEGVRPVTIAAVVRVSKDVFSMKVKPANVVAAVGAPAFFQISLENKASASDSIDLLLSGFPGASNHSKRILLPRMSIVTIPIEISSNEQATYNIEFRSVSRSSPKLDAVAAATVTTKASLLEDVRSSGYGILLFPNALQPVLGILAFLANAFAS